MIIPALVFPDDPRLKIIDHEMMLGPQDGLLWKEQHMAIRCFGGENVREITCIGETVTVRI